MNITRARRRNTRKRKARLSACISSSKCTWLTDEQPGDNCFILEDNTAAVRPDRQRRHALERQPSGDAVIDDHCFISSHVVVRGRVRHRRVLLSASRDDSQRDHDRAGNARRRRCDHHATPRNLASTCRSARQICARATKSRFDRLDQTRAAVRRNTSRVGHERGASSGGCPVRRWPARISALRDDRGRARIGWADSDPPEWRVARATRRPCWRRRWEVSPTTASQLVPGSSRAA